MKKQIEIYRSNNGETSVEVTFEKESVWLNQYLLSDLFGRDRTVVGRHIKNIFKEWNSSFLYSWQEQVNAYFG